MGSGFFLSPPPNSEKQTKQDLDIEIQKENDSRLQKERRLSQRCLGQISVFGEEAGPRLCQE